MIYQNILVSRTALLAAEAAEISFTAWLDII
jgi:hypothetical protein